MPRRVMVSDQFLVFDQDGVSYTGEFERRGTITYEGREVNQYALTNGRARMVFNGTLNLDSALENVQDGEQVEILYEGATALPEGKTVKKFQVWVIEPGDEEETENGD